MYFSCASSQFLRFFKEGLHPKRILLNSALPDMKKHELIRAIFYIVNLLFFLFYVIPTISAPVYTKCVRYHICSRYLHNSGWPFYVPIDLADSQWRDIRSNMPLLWVCLFGTTLGHYFVRKCITRSQFASLLGGDTMTDEDFEAKKSSWFRMLVGIVFIGVMHKFHAIIIILIACGTYVLAMWLSGCNGSNAVTWVVALSLLLLKEAYRYQDDLNIPVSKKFACVCLRLSE